MGFHEASFYIKLDIIVKRLLYGDDNLTTVELERKKEGNDVMKAISQALTSNPYITKLSFTFSQINDKGAIYISEYLKNTRSLEELILSNNKISGEGAKFICNALCMNKTVTALNLDHNPLGNDGAIALSQVIKYNACLLKISIDDTLIKDSGFRTIMSSLALNFTLQSLSIRANKLSAASKHLEEMLVQNFSLRTLLLSDEPLPQNLISILSRNEKGNVALETGKGPLLFSNTLFTASLSNIDPSSEVIETVMAAKMGLESIPPKIFSSKYITFLDLRGNNLTEIQEDLGQMLSLKTLHLSNNELRSLPFSITQLTALETLSLQHNPLTWIPHNEINHDEIHSRPPQETSLFRFLRESKIKGPDVPFQKSKLFFLGGRMSGKTAMKTLIQGERTSRSPKWSYILPPYVPTYGIHISEIKVKHDETTETLQIWEFGGTDQQLMSFIPFMKAVEKHVVAINLCEFDSEFSQRTLDMMRVVNSVCGRKAVLLVGTHTDKLTTHEVEEIKAKVRGILSQNVVNDFCAISSKLANGIDILKSKLSSPKRMYRTATLVVYQVLKSIRRIKPYIMNEEFVGICNYYGIRGDDEIQKAQEDLTHLGVILTYPGPKIKNFVFLNLQFLASIVCDLLMLAASSHTDGVLKKNECRLAWIDTRQHYVDENDIFEWCVDLGLTHELDSTNILVPSFLPMNPPHLSKHFGSKRPLEWVTLNRAYEFEYLPLHIFSQLCLACLNIEHSEQLCWWRYGIVFSLKSERCKMTVDIEHSKLLLQVQSTEKYLIPSHLLNIVQVTIERTLSLWWPNMKYTNLIQKFSPGSTKEYLAVQEYKAVVPVKDELIYRWVAPDLFPFDFDTWTPNHTLTSEETLSMNVFKATIDNASVEVKEYDHNATGEFHYILRTLPYLQHPKVTAFVGATKSPQRIITDFAYHGTLDTLLPRVGDCSLPLTYRIRIALDIAIALEFVLSQHPFLAINGLTTSFVKIYSLEEDEVVAKLDFAHQRPVNFHDSIFAAPELVSGRMELHRSDIYSFGIILWQLWMGKNVDHLKSLPTDSSFDRMNTPLRELDDLLSSCLHHNEMKRPEFGQIAHQLANIYKMLGAKSIPKDILRRSHKLSEWNKHTIIQLSEHPQIVAIAGADDNLYCACNNGKLYSFTISHDGLQKHSEVTVGDSKFRINDIAICGNNIWAICDSNCLLVIRRDTMEITAMDFHHGLCVVCDNNMIYVGSANGCITIYEGKTTLKRKEFIEEDKMPITAITTDENYIYAAVTKVEPDNCCGYVCVFNKQLELLHKWEAHSRMITGILHQNDILWTGSFDKVLNTWHVDHDGQMIKTKSIKSLLPHKERILQLSQHYGRGYSLDKNVLISWNLNDYSIDSRIEISNASCMYIHTDCVLITGSKEGLVTLWRKHYQ